MQASNINSLPKTEDQRGSLTQRVYDSLREGILSMMLAPGEELRKLAICEHFNVSRAPVSEALARLSHEGLVDIIPQSGTRVAYLSMPQILESQFIREALEIAAVTKVAQIRSEDTLSKLTRNLRMQQLMIEDHDLLGFHQTDEEFHGIIAQGTGFSRLSELANKVSVQVIRARRLVLPTHGRAIATLSEHKAVFEAIRKQHVDEAQTSMNYHLQQLIKRLAPLERARPELFGYSEDDLPASAKINE